MKVTIPPPPTALLQVSVGGTPGDGRVDVARQPSGAGHLAYVPTGTSAGVPLSGETELWLHYFAEEGKPQTVVVEIQPSPVS